MSNKEFTRIPFDEYLREDMDRFIDSFVEGREAMVVGWDRKLLLRHAENALRRKRLSFRVNVPQCMIEIRVLPDKCTRLTILDNGRYETVRGINFDIALILEDRDE